MKMKKMVALLLALVMVILNSAVFAVKFDITHKTDASKNTTLFELTQDYDLIMEVFGAAEDYEIEYENGLRYNFKEVVEYRNAHKDMPLSEVFKNLRPVNEQPTVELEVIDISKLNKNSITVSFTTAAKEIESVGLIITKDEEAVEVTPVPIAAGATSATFNFVTPFTSDADLVGTWMVKGKNQATPISKTVALPTVVEARATGAKSVLVKFDMALESATAANFKIVPGEENAQEFAVESATVQNDANNEPKHVLLTWTTGDLGATPKLKLMDEAVVALFGVANTARENITVQPDNVKPVLEKAVFDKAASTITLTFSKEVSATLPNTKIRMNDGPLNITKVTKDGNNLVLQLNPMLKAQYRAWLGQNDNRINLLAGAVSAANNSQLVNDAANVPMEILVTPEWNDEASSYDVITRTLKLAFDEAVTVADITKISVGKAEDNLTALTDAAQATVDAENAKIINIVLNKEAADQLRGLQIGKNLFVKVEADAVQNANNKKNTQNVTKQIQYNADQTGPNLVLANFEAGFAELTLTFSEDIRPVASVEDDKIIFLVGTERVVTKTADFEAGVNVKNNVLTVTMKDTTPNAEGSNLDKLAAGYQANKTIKVLLAADFVKDFAGATETDGNNANTATEEANAIVLNYEDVTIPTIENVTTISRNRVKVVFNTPMNKESVNANNISIVDFKGNAVVVSEVFAEDDLRTFHIQTAQELRYRSGGKAYTMTVRNLKSKSYVLLREGIATFDGSRDASDTDAPVIQNANFNAVQGYDNDIITVVFEDANSMKEDTVKVKESYTLLKGDAPVANFAVKELNYVAGTKTVTLTVQGVNLDATATDYKIKVVGVADFYNNVNPAGAMKELTNNSTDREFIKDGITGETTSEINTITLTFPEELDKASAVVVDNYKVVLDQETAPTSAIIDEAGKVVTLTMAEGVKFNGANVNVKLQAGLKDAASNQLGEEKEIAVPVTDATKPNFAAQNAVVAVANTKLTGDTIVLTFSENVTNNDALMNKANYTVFIGEEEIASEAVATVAVEGQNGVKLTLDAEQANFIKGNVIKVDIAANTLTDAANNSNTEVLSATGTATAANDGTTAATAKLLTQKTALVTFQNGLVANTVSTDDFAIENVTITAAAVGAGEKANEVTLTFQDNVTAGAPIVIKAGQAFAINDDMGHQLTNAVLGADNGIPTSNKVVVIAEAQAFTVTYDGTDNTPEAFHFTVTAHAGEEISTNGTAWEDATGQAQKVMIAKDGATITVRVKRPAIGADDIVVEAQPRTQVMTKPVAPQNVSHEGEFNAIRLTNANDTMEYTLDNGATWTTVGTGTIAITAQQSLKIRVKASPTNVPSETVEVIEADNTLPQLTELVATAKADDQNDTIVLTFSENLKNTAELIAKESYQITVANQQLVADDFVAPVFNGTNEVTIDLVPARKHLYKGEAVVVNILQGKVHDLRGNANAVVLSLTKEAVAAAEAVNTAATAEIITNLKTLKLTFGSTLLSTSVTTDDFTVDGNEVLTASVGTGAQANEVTLTFRDDLAKGTVAVKPAVGFEIKDTMGNSLDRSVLNGDTGLTVKTQAEAPEALTMTIQSKTAAGGNFTYTFEALAGQEYKVSKGAQVVTNWTDVTPGTMEIEVEENTAEDYTIEIRVKATATMHESELKSATIGKAADAPAVTKAPDSALGQVKLEGATADMEYSLNNGQTWHDFTEGQIAGTETFSQALIVRVKATNERVASQKTQSIAP